MTRHIDCCRVGAVGSRSVRLWCGLCGQYQHHGPGMKGVPVTIQLGLGFRVYRSGGHGRQIWLSYKMVMF